MFLVLIQRTGPEWNPSRTLEEQSGWLAHAAEEYQHRLRFRPRAVYTGPAPTSS